MDANGHASSLLKRGLKWVIDSKAEAITLLVALATYMPSAFIQNLIIQKLCLRRNFTRDYCSSDAINETLEDSMQGEATQLLFYFFLLRQLPPVILVLFMGQWCDKYGRKYVIIISIAGCAISASLYFVNVWFDDWPPIFVVLSAVPDGFSGGRAAYQMGLMGFLRDIHPIKSMSVRMATVSGVDCLAQLIGPLISGQLFLRFGAKAVILTCTVMLVVAIVLTAIFVKDEKFKKRVAIRVALRDFFDGRGFVSSVATVFKKRDGHLRAYIFCVLVSLFINTMSLNGFNEVFFLYTRLTVEWDAVTLNLYNGLVGGAGAFGSVILLPLLVHLFHWPDAILGLLGLTTTAAYYYILAMVNKSVVYKGAISLMIFNMFGSVTFRSIVTKCISFSETGKVMAVFAVVQIGSLSVGQMVAAQIYARTYAFFPGATMVFFGSVGLVGVALFAWIFVDLRMNNIVLEEANREDN